MISQEVEEEEENTTLTLTELKKGYFLHFFNRKENQCYVGQSMNQSINFT